MSDKVRVCGTSNIWLDDLGGSSGRSDLLLHSTFRLDHGWTFRASLVIVQISASGEVLTTVAATDHVSLMVLSDMDFGVFLRRELLLADNALDLVFDMAVFEVGSQSTFTAVVLATIVTFPALWLIRGVGVGLEGELSCPLLSCWVRFLVIIQFRLSGENLEQMSQWNCFAVCFFLCLLRIVCSA